MFQQDIGKFNPQIFTSSTSRPPKVDMPDSMVSGMGCLSVGFKNGFRKDVCRKEIGLRVQIMITIPIQ